MPVVERAQKSDEFDPAVWMSPGEVARKMRVSIDTVYRACRAGTPFRAVKSFGVWWIRRDDVEAHVAFVRRELGLDGGS